MGKAKDFYFLFVVVFSGLGTMFYRSHIGLIVLFLIGLILFNKRMVRPTKTWLFAIAVWMGYFLINTIIIRSFHPFFMATYIIKITIAWWLLDYYKDKIFLKFENVIFFFASISLFFWTWQLIHPGSLNTIMSALNISGFGADGSKNIFFYTYHHQFVPGEFPRNAGFCWEPGPFSSYVILALFINLARNGLKLKDKKRLLVFMLAIVTAQSTTSFVVLLAVLVWYAWSSVKNKAFRIISIPITLTLVIYLFTSVPWMQEKIISESEQDIEELLVHASRTGSSYAPGRFASLQLRWKDFKNYPIAGFGGNSSLQAGYLGEDNVVAAINGVGTIMGKYGSIGFLLFLWLIFKTGKWLGSYYQYSAHIIFPILVLMIGFGFAIIESPIFVTLWLIPVFLPIKKYLIE